MSQKATGNKNGMAQEDMASRVKETAKGYKRKAKDMKGFYVKAGRGVPKAVPLTHKEERILDMMMLYTKDGKAQVYRYVDEKLLAKYDMVDSDYYIPFSDFLGSDGYHEKDGRELYFNIDGVLAHVEANPDERLYLYSDGEILEFFAGENADRQYDFISLYVRTENFGLFAAATTPRCGGVIPKVIYKLYQLDGVKGSAKDERFTICQTLMSVAANEIVEHFFDNLLRNRGTGGKTTEPVQAE